MHIRHQRLVQLIGFCHRTGSPPVFRMGIQGIGKGMLLLVCHRTSLWRCIRTKLPLISSLGIGSEPYRAVRSLCHSPCHRACQTHRFHCDADYLSDSEGHQYPVQKTADGAVAFVREIPSKGYRRFRKGVYGDENREETKAFNLVDEHTLETPYYIVHLDENGDHFIYLMDGRPGQNIMELVDQRLLPDGIQLFLRIRKIPLGAPGRMRCGYALYVVYIPALFRIVNINIPVIIINGLRRQPAE